MQSPYRTMFRNFREKWSAMLGVYMFLAIFLAVFILPIFFPLDTQFQDPTQQNTRPTFSYMKYDKALQGNVASIDGGSVFGVGVDRDGKLYQWGTLSAKLQKMPPPTSVMCRLPPAWITPSPSMPTARCIPGEMIGSR